MTTDYRNASGEYLFNVPEGQPVPAGYAPVEFVRGGTLQGIEVAVQTDPDVNHATDKHKGRLSASRTLPLLGIDKTNRFNPAAAGMKAENHHGMTVFRAKDGALCNSRGQQIITSRRDIERLKAQGWVRE